MGRMLNPFIGISSVLKNPVSRRIRIFSIWPGYLRVFSFMLGALIVFTRERRPSVLNASSVPMPGKLLSSASESAAFTTIFPSSTIRAGRVYSSMTSMGENTALYSQGHSRTSGNPPT
jgi:hypothetical protein